MAIPFDPENFPKTLKDIRKKRQRSDRPINAYLSKLQAASELLSEYFWLPKAGAGDVMMFKKKRKKVTTDLNNPERVPWV